VKRRDVLKSSLLASSAFVVNNAVAGSNPSSIDAPKLKGRVNHSACRWCYGKIPLEELLDRAKDMGMKSIELLNPDEWDAAIKRGLTCAISNGSPLSIPKGFNDVQYHDQLYKDISPLIPRAAEKGIPQIIVFSGNRGRISEQIGLEHCAKGLDKLVKMAEKSGVMLTMELLNSARDHKDYMCDNSKWGVKLVEKIGSPNFKLLYDIYHMQIMEGNVIDNIKKNAKYYGHYHTGGVPGRNEIDETQELNYVAIMKAIVDTGFKGFVAQEFIPKSTKPLESLKKAIKLCDV
jgi:hydroxypyruvate isomerase